MNQICLKGVLTNIRFSHTIKDIEYNKADIITKRKDGKEDILTLEFKKFSNPYKNDNGIVELMGNVRSYSQKTDDGKNKVSIFVFTYFDRPKTENETEAPENEFILDGRICKIDEIHTTLSGKQNIHFVIANNIITDDNTQKLNSYIPCIAWGKMAKALSFYNVNDYICIKGELHSREYKKYLPDDSFEIRVAHEAVITSIIDSIKQK